MAEVVDSLKLDMTDHKHELYKSRVTILQPVWTLLAMCLWDLLRFSMFEVLLWRKLECQLKMWKWPINSRWFWEVEGKNLLVCIWKNGRKEKRRKGRKEERKKGRKKKAPLKGRLFFPSSSLLFFKVDSHDEVYQAKKLRPGGWKMPMLHAARKMQVAAGQASRARCSPARALWLSFMQRSAS